MVKECFISFFFIRVDWNIGTSTVRSIVMMRIVVQVCTHFYVRVFTKGAKSVQL